MIAGFIPPNDVIRYFELLMDEIHNNFNDECDNLIDYFEGTCIYYSIYKWYSGPVYKWGQEIMFPSHLLPPLLLYRAKLFLNKLFNFFYVGFSRASEMRF